jgi:hypothetical protein
MSGSARQASAETSYAKAHPKKLRDSGIGWARDHVPAATSTTRTSRVGRNVAGSQPSMTTTCLPSPADAHRAKSGMTPHDAAPFTRRHSPVVRFAIVRQLSGGELAFPSMAAAASWARNTTSSFAPAILRRWQNSCVTHVDKP